MAYNEATLRGDGDLICSITFKCTAELKEMAEKYSKLEGDEGSTSRFARDATIAKVLEHDRIAQQYDRARGLTTDTVDTRSNKVGR